MTIDELKTAIVDFLRDRDGWTDIVVLSQLTNDYSMLTTAVKQLEKDKIISVIPIKKNSKLMRLL